MNNSFKASKIVERKITKTLSCHVPRGDDVWEVEVEDEDVFVGKSLTATVT